jgi:cob(I)alamin adenosyltransferase
MKIYTRTGDQGETSLLGGRVPKDHIRIEAIGTVDECNAQLGEAIVRCQQQKSLISLVPVLQQIQHELFDVGADLAQTEATCYHRVDGSMVDRLEAWIDQFDRELPAINNFILPGGSPAAASLHLCRVLVRRAERRVVTLHQQKRGHQQINCYLNRLSDLLFVLARVANVRTKTPEIQYRGKEDAFMLTLYEYPKCGTCRKAKKWLDEHKAAYQTIHIVKQPPSIDQLRTWVEKSDLPVQKWFNTSGQKYRELQLSRRTKTMSDEEKLQLLASDGMLIKRPIAIQGDRVLVGFRPEVYEEHFLA